jgi:hypothetical protein
MAIFYQSSAGFSRARRSRSNYPTAYFNRVYDAGRKASASLVPNLTQTMHSKSVSIKPRGLLAAFSIAILTAIPAYSGDIAGVVTDVTRQTNLPSASVTLVGTGLTAATNSNGRFDFTDVPEGDYQVRVDYFGYDSVTESVHVPATGEARVVIQMGATVVKMEKYVVGGYRESQQLAVQEKKSAANVMDVISADAIGRLPDRNAAEAVARLPGVNLDFGGDDQAQGEARYVSIRGVDPNLNQVLMDGATMAAPGGSRLGRAVPLNTLSAGQISSIEVIKSVTPDLDANAVGGTINIKSASGFDWSGRRITGSVAGVRNGNANKTDGAAELTFSDRFGPGDKWGLATSVSYDRRSYANEWLQFGWSQVNINGKNLYLPNDFEIKPEWGLQGSRGSDRQSRVPAGRQHPVLHPPGLLARQESRKAIRGHSFAGHNPIQGRPDVRHGRHVQSGSHRAPVL